YCQNSMITRCLENRVFAVTANRIGQETRGDDDFVFTGRSQIAGVFGEILSSAPAESAFVGTVNIDNHLADSKSLNPNNDLFNDRREDFYF
ncbi:MAG: hypothetical protein PHY99_09370, partial [Bacteroidales bacterium]|nr:hypothetical protein [Bacteroidales bacterium]